MRADIDRLAPGIRDVEEEKDVRTVTGFHFRGGRRLVFGRKEKKRRRRRRRRNRSPFIVLEPLLGRLAGVIAVAKVHAAYFFALL